MELRVDNWPLLLFLLLLCCSVIGIEGVWTTPTPQTSDTRTLLPASSVSRMLRTDELHRYAFHVGAQETVRITIDPGDMSIRVRLLESGREGLIKVMGEEHYGGETVSVLTAMAATITLEVSRLAKNAAASRYGLEIGERRTALPADALRVRSERLFADANSLIARNTLDAFSHAGELLEESLSGFRAASARRKEAQVLNALGTIRRRQNDARGAFEAHRRALTIFRAERDRFGEASSLTHISNVYADLGDGEQVLAHLRSALPLIKAQGSINALAMTHYKAGVYAQQLGHWQQAFSYYRHALQNPQTKHRHDPIRGMGDLMADLGEYEKAHVFYDQALTLSHRNSDRFAEADTLHAKASTFAAQQAWNRALDLYGRALTLSREIGYGRREASTLRGLGSVHRSQGDAAAALTYLRQGLRLAHAMGHPDDKALLLAELGRAQLDLGSFSEARASLEDALQTFRSSGERLEEARTLAAIARAEMAHGELDTALDHIEQATALADILRDRVSRQDLRASFSTTVRTIHETHIDVLMQLHERDPSAGYDKTALAASDHARARGLLEVLRESRGDLAADVPPSLSARARELEHTLDAKGLYRYRLQTAGVAAATLPASDQELDHLIDAYRDLLAELHSASPRHAALTRPARLDPRAWMQRLLDDSTQVLYFSLGERRSYLWSVSREAFLAYTLPPRGEIEAAARRLHKLLTQSHWRGAEGQTELAASKLSKLLLAPLADRLTKERLLIVADGALSSIPFSVLPIPGDAQQAPLLHQHEVVHVPSLSVLEHLRATKPRWGSQAQRIAVIADPVFTAHDSRVPEASPAPRNRRAAARETPRGRSGLARSADDLGISVFARLPFSRQEAESVFQMAAAERRLLALDFDASLETITSGELHDFDIVHFATHTVLDDENPELSGLVLSLVDEDGALQDGFLRAYRIANLDLAAGLVVLSGCQTALGKEIRGEGVLGLSRAFMHAGVPRMIVSLWKVSDRATAALMNRFYSKIVKDGAAPAAALRAAQRALRADVRWRAPFYWAGFQLQGDWQ